MKYTASGMKNLENIWGREISSAEGADRAGWTAGDVRASGVINRRRKRCRNCVVSVSDNRSNFLTKGDLKTARGEGGKSFFHPRAIEADSRMGPPANIVEENVDSDSGSSPSGGFSRTIQSFSDGKRGRGRENSATAARSNVLAAGTGPVSFDFRLFSPPWRNTSRRKDRKLAGGAYSFPPRLPLPSRLFLLLAACPNGSRTNKSL